MSWHINVDRIGIIFQNHTLNRLFSSGRDDYGTEVLTDNAGYELVLAKAGEEIDLVIRDSESGRIIYEKASDHLDNEDINGVEYVVEQYLVMLMRNDIITEFDRVDDFRKTILDGIWNKQKHGF